MLLAEYLAVANPTQRGKYATLKARELKDIRTTLNRADTIRRGRNYIMKSEIGKMTEHLSDAKLLDKKKKMVQESSPEVAYSTFNGNDDMKACTRLTILRKLRRFQKMTVVIGGVQSRVTFGSHAPLAVDVRAP